MQSLNILPLLFSGIGKEWGIKDHCATQHGQIDKELSSQLLQVKQLHDAEKSSLLRFETLL